MKKWARANYMPNKPLYEGKPHVTAGEDHLLFSKKAAQEAARKAEAQAAEDSIRSAAAKQTDLYPLDTQAKRKAYGMLKGYLKYDCSDSPRLKDCYKRLHAGNVTESEMKTIYRFILQNTHPDHGGNQELCTKFNNIFDILSGKYTH